MNTQAPLSRNETGIEAAIGVLRQQFPDRIETGQALREQHGHTTTWIENQPPDAVFFPTATSEVQEALRKAVMACDDKDRPEPYV